ncbi:NUMOD1 domain-containing DNA-binding protein [Hyphococcus sp. DH-69]|uniref:NUMOD1 domain-containing DNA-binding protein n=1 Tax=Hyphococcus formosus TaxID=3143534 RepID=UPI00398A7F39
MNNDPKDDPILFKRWFDTMGFKSKQEAAKALNVHRNTIINYESGRLPVPHTTKLAMTALFHRLSPWE